jgi:hypothetical protein
MQYEFPNKDFLSEKTREVRFIAILNIFSVKGKVKLSLCLTN